MIPVLSEQRIKSIKAYLAKPGVEFCNQFVVTAKNMPAENLVDTLTRLSLKNGLVLEELHPVFKYLVRFL